MVSGLHYEDPVSSPVFLRQKTLTILLNSIISAELKLTRDQTKPYPLKQAEQIYLGTARSAPGLD